MFDFMGSHHEAVAYARGRAEILIRKAERNGQDFTKLDILLEDIERKVKFFEHNPISVVDERSRDPYSNAPFQEELFLVELKDHLEFLRKDIREKDSKKLAEHARGLRDRLVYLEKEIRRAAEEVKRAGIIHIKPNHHHAAIKARAKVRELRRHLEKHPEHLGITARLIEEVEEELRPITKSPIAIKDKSRKDPETGKPVEEKTYVERIREELKSLNRHLEDTNTTQLLETTRRISEELDTLARIIDRAAEKIA